MRARETSEGCAYSRTRECEKIFISNCLCTRIKKNRRGFLKLHETKIRIFVLVHPHVIREHKNSNLFCAREYLPDEHAILLAAVLITCARARGLRWRRLRSSPDLRLTRLIPIGIGRTPGRTYSMTSEMVSRTRARVELERIIEKRLSNLEKIFEEHLEAHKEAEEKVDVSSTN